MPCNDDGDDDDSRARCGRWASRPPRAPVAPRPHLRRLHLPARRLQRRVRVLQQHVQLVEGGWVLVLPGRAGGTRAREGEAKEGKGISGGCAGHLRAEATTAAETGAGRGEDSAGKRRCSHCLCRLPPSRGPRAMCVWGGRAHLEAQQQSLLYGAHGGGSLLQRLLELPHAHAARPVQVHHLHRREGGGPRSVQVHHLQRNKGSSGGQPAAHATRARSISTAPNLAMQVHHLRGQVRRRAAHAGSPCISPAPTLPLRVHNPQGQRKRGACVSARARVRACVRISVRADVRAQQGRGSAATRCSTKGPSHGSSGAGRGQGVRRRAPRHTKAGAAASAGATPAVRPPGASQIQHSHHAHKTAWVWPLRKPPPRLPHA